MKLITTQSFTDDDVVKEKQENHDYAVLVTPEFQLDGEPCRAVLDGHHSLEAARRDGVEPIMIEAGKDNAGGRTKPILDAGTRDPIYADGKSERKQSDNYGGPGYSIGELISAAISKIGSLFSRTDDVQEQEDQAPAPPVARSNITSSALKAALQNLQGQLDDASSLWERTQAEADDLKATMEDMTAGIRAITATLGQQYAQNTAEALANNLAARAEQWDQLNAQAKDLRVQVLELQAQVQAVEQQIEGKARRLGMEHKAEAETEQLDVIDEQLQQPEALDDEELQALLYELSGMMTELTGEERARAAELFRIVKANMRMRKSAKAFWDPTDDEDAAAIKEKIDALATSVDRAIEDNDEEEQAELLAELRDLDDGLTDDTRFRVQALIERLGGTQKSAAGAHALYHR